MTQNIVKKNKPAHDILEKYALGELSPAKHIIISCQKKLSQEVADHVDIEETMASSALDDVSIQPLSPRFMGDVLAALPPQTHLENKQSINDNESEFDLDEAVQKVKWNKFIPTVSVHNIIGSSRTRGEDRLYLFRAKAGTKIPEHSHSGEEWVLLLKGSYMSNGKVYKRGDLHRVGDDETHSLEISKDEDCICLAMSEDKIKMTGILPRIAQKVIGI